MSAKIKLKRIGTKNRPQYRVVVQDESSSPVSDVVDILGIYQPLKGSNVLDVKADKVAAWLKKGAKPTEKVRILFGKAGLMPPIDLAALPKRKAKGEAAAPAESAAAEAPAKEA
ncbi:30S ribosomal protein S16 [candidate division WOR-1 bacterium RIFOXYB2_FULL_48_7]|uniref:Small ribosomal subunit protein bS16 n=1 Tax=candidate division WOR-1 bacterium RIFOXYB2_FULL_48_7 TaxID=1802583 RepID=A0A1F4TDA1_UNCSA|nr:MAG: 30S ribosomal protein S16 [candidate division WOR-1 bacterium RIFOXYB2_FULL_48_7]